jgi:hypothetical protein
MKLFIYSDKSKTREAVNIDKYSSIKLDKKIVAFYNSLTDRVNWEFETEEDAEKCYNEVLLNHGNKITIK